MIRSGLRRILSIERALLLGVSAVGAALFLFFKLGSEAAEGDTMAFDRFILLAFRQPGNPATPVGPWWLTEAMTNVTAFGSLTGLLLIGGAVVGYLVLDAKRRTALFVIAATVGGGMLGVLLKLAYQRSRPDLVPHLVEVSSTSFPSGHATDSAVVYLTLAALLARTVENRSLRLYILCMAALLVLLIGISRVYLGVHWPSDVVAGWSIGAAWALACSLIYSRIWAARHLPETE